MIEIIKGKRVNISVAFMPKMGMEYMTTKCFEGVVDTCSTLGGESFIVFEDGTMINMKYVQTIEIM